MDRDIYSTNEWNEKIQICEDIDEFRKEIIENLSQQKEAWKEKINKIISDNQYTITQFAALCDVSRVTVNKWLKGSVPKNREMFLRIGFAAKYDLDEMNNFLMRYGRYQGLYAKTLEDSICIFVLSSSNMEHTYDSYSHLLSKIKDEIFYDNNRCGELYETTYVLDKITVLNSDIEMIEFINENSGFYKSQYNRFYSYVLGFLKINKMTLSEEKGISTHFMANGQGWSSSLRQTISAINQRKWYPVRDKIISVGIHLNMDVDQINEMLNLAHMESLCSKNIFESVIIYALENAKLEEQIFCDGTDALCMYVRDVIEELDLDETEFFIDELPDEY